MPRPAETGVTTLDERRQAVASVRVQDAGTGSLLAENVARIIQRAYSKREAATADATVELIAQACEAGDAVCEIGAPGGR